jgi:transcriptional antiterminator NusG
MPDIENANEDNAEFEQSDLAPSGAGTPSASDADATASEEIPADGVPEDGVPEDGVPEDAALEDAAPEGEDTRHWYIIHTYSGFERKVAESLRTRAEAFGFSSQIGQILIPEEEVVELRNGKKVTSKRLLYPGYVVVQMEMNDELWHRVKDTPRVTGFVGGGQTPVPLSADEINKMLYRQTTAAERPRPKMTFEKGEQVRIIDGPFANFQGKVDEINPERNTLRVLVTIFGRATPVELDFLQVEKTA